MASRPGSGFQYDRPGPRPAQAGRGLRPEPAHQYLHGSRFPSRSCELSHYQRSFRDRDWYSVCVYDDDRQGHPTSGVCIKCTFQITSFCSKVCRIRRTALASGWSFFAHWSSGNTAHDFIFSHRVSSCPHTFALYYKPSSAYQSFYQRVFMGTGNR